MAWRDSRTSRRRLLLFSTSIVLGIAALVAISSFGRSLEKALDAQAKSLLGADLVLASRSAFGAKEEKLFQSLGGNQSREVDFSSMVYFPKSEGTRLVQIRALEGEFPFYGKLETDPDGAAADFRRGNGALVEETLLIQYNAKVGDPVRVGDLTTRIAGSLRKVPGETVAFAVISPRVYLPMRDLPKTGLLRQGSMARYRVYFQFTSQTNVSRLVQKIRPQLNELRLSHNTVEMRKKDLGRSMDDLSNFLNLAGFIALLLGGVGVANAIHVHIKQKLDTVAVLRCLGCSVGQTFAIYLLQGMVLGAIGALIGAMLGLGIQTVLPRVVADFLPFPVPVAISWGVVLLAMAQGFFICILFALLPLLGVRRVSPLAAIRSLYESRGGRRDPLLWAVYLLIACGLVLFCLAHSRRWHQGLGFAAGLGIAFGLLAGVAKLMVQLVKKAVPASLPYVWRQGLANLHRPNNRTVLLMLSLGLGTFLILTLYLAHDTLLRELESSRPGSEANLVLFDVQDDQKQPVADLVRSQDLPVLDEAPIISMRLSSIKGRPVEDILADTNKTIPNWVLRREYRSTFDDRLRAGEKIIAGQWHGNASRGEMVPLSIEESIAKEMVVGLGDQIVFDVQGVPLTARVASLRQVDWRRVQPTVYLLFPRGVLEDAPATHVLLTRASAEKSAGLQRLLVQKFPNVLAIDVTLILQTLDAILGKISFVLRFMALFTVITGLLVLAGAILTGRYQRIHESILLRTLGASRAQILKILLVEYFCLGLLAALTGVLLAIAATWALAAFVFDVRFVLSLLAPLIAVVIVSGLTVLTGLLASGGVLNHPPLEILRAEV
jgi:putative ABC transport system permease protein